MSERFELTITNPVVKMWLLLIIPTVLLQLFLLLFTDVTRMILALIPVLSLTIFIVWFYLHKRSIQKAGK